MEDKIMLKGNNVSQGKVVFHNLIELTKSQLEEQLKRYGIVINGKCKCLYEPLVRPLEFGGHWFWTNFLVQIRETANRGMGKNDTTRETLTKRKGFDWESLKGLDRELVLRNCVEPELGLHIFNCMLDSKKTLFD